MPSRTSRARQAALLGALTMFTLGRTTRADTDVCYSGGTLLPNFQLNGNAELNGTDLIVTPSATQQRSSVMYNPKFSAASDFHIELQIKISHNSSGGADGMAFVMHNDPAGPSALGMPGGGIGYQGITNSVIVEFDTWQNDWDPNANHIAITQAGDPDHQDATNMGLPVVTDPNGIDLKSGDPVYLWIDYDHMTTTLSVFVAASSAKPATAAMTATMDLGTAIGSTFYVGFTGSTGGAWSQHEVVELFASDHLADPQDGCCMTDADCSSSPSGPVCDVAKHLCGVCTVENTSNCPAATPACDVSASSDQCVLACNGNNGSSATQACVSGEFPACKASGSCTACNGDYQSTATIMCATGAPYCSPTGYCGFCTQNSDCATTNAVHTGVYCNTTTGACVTTCSADADCGPGNVCDSKDQKCGYANGDGPCTSANAASVCRSGTCGKSSLECTPAGSNACAGDSDCVPGKTYCNGSTFSCVPTLANGQPIPGDPIHSATCTATIGEAVCASGSCATSGPNIGKCEPCATDANCSGATPVCSPTTNQCVACATCGGSTDAGVDAAAHRAEGGVDASAAAADGGEGAPASGGGCSLAVAGRSESFEGVSGFGAILALLGSGARRRRGRQLQGGRNLGSAATDEGGWIAKTPRRQGWSRS
jgi:hypothetical protein